MASIVSALAKATGKTASAPVKEARDYVSKQIDPTRALYGLGLGVGPLIKQTVGEYKRQREADKNRKEEAKEAGLDRKAIKQSSQSSASALGVISKQLNSLATTMREVRELNRQQLKIMRGGVSGGVSAAKPMATATSLKAAADDDRTPLRQGGSELLSSILGGAKTAGLFGLAGIAGSLLYANRKEIMEGLDEFFKGAGLGSTSEVIENLKKDISGAVDDIGTTIGKSIKDAVDESLKDLKDLIWKQMGFPKPGQAGESGPTPATGSAPSWTDYVTKQSMGSAAGAIIGGRVLGVPGAIGGGILGSEYPDEALGAAAIGTSLWGLNKLRKAAAAKKAAEATAAAAAAERAAATAAAAPRAPTIPAPGSLAVPGMQTSPGGILIPDSAGRGARTVDDARRMTDAATKQIGLWDKIKVAANEAGQITSNPAFKSVLSWAGKATAALGTGVTVLQAYDDIKDGDYAAASVRLSGLVASLGLATFGSAVATPVVGVSSSIAVGVGSSVAADKLKKANRTTSAGTPVVESFPEYNAMGDMVGYGRAAPAPAAPARPAAPAPARPAAAATTPPAAQPAPAQSAPVAATPPAATTLPPSSSRYSMPIDGSPTVVGGFGEPRQGHLHQGVDIAMPQGTPVKAIADGRVITAGSGGGYGNYVRIIHTDGRSSLYAHLDKIFVKAGDMVKAGQQIGTVGMTGVSTGPHLHLEIYDTDGSLINPYSVLPNLPRYSGKPVAGVTGATDYDGMGPASMAPGARGITTSPASTVGASSESMPSGTSPFRNPFDPHSSREHLVRMGFTQSQIPQLLDAQTSMRDLMNIGDDIKAMFFGGEGGGPSSGSIPTQPPSGGGANVTPPSPQMSDFEKDRLMRMNAHRAALPAWAQ